MLYRNLSLKIAAACLAIFLWFWVTINEHDLGGPEVRVRTSGLSMVNARTVPVVLRTRGALPQDLRVTGVQLDPSMVTVVGSSLRLADVTVIQTDELDLRRATGSFDRQLGLVTPPGVQIPNADSVKVSVQVVSAPPADPSPSPQTPAAKPAS